MHQSACRIVNKRQQRALLRAILKPRMFRAVDLHQLAKAIAPAAWLMRGGQTMPTVPPQSIGDHPTAQSLARHRTAMVLCQLLYRQGRAEVGVSVPHDRRGKSTNFGRQTVIAGFGSALR